MLRVLKIFGLGAACVCAVGALAQSADLIDVEAIRERARVFAQDATAVVNGAEADAEAHRQNAQEIVDAAFEEMGAYAQLQSDGSSDGPVDFDAIVSIAGENIKAREAGPPLFVAFASLSMPDDSLRRMINEVGAAGGVVVFRGFTNNSAKTFTSGLARVLGEDAGAVSLSIDPRLFRAFNVQRVPTYVVSSRSFDLCDGLDCVSTPPAHDKIVGNVTTQYVLETIVSDNGAGALVAQKALANLKDARR